MSESLPSWLLGNSPIATRPFVSAPIASSASLSRTFTEWVAGRSLPSLNLNSALPACAQAPPVTVPEPINAPVARKVLLVNIDLSPLGVAAAFGMPPFELSA